MTVFLPFHNLYISPCLSLQSVSHVIYLLYQLISFDLTLMYKLLEDISCFWYYFHWSLTSIYISTWDVVNRKNLFEFTNSLFFFFAKLRDIEMDTQRKVYIQRDHASADLFLRHLQLLRFGQIKARNWTCSPCLLCEWQEPNYMKWLCLLPQSALAGSWN